jgi:hypothetical protein
MTLRGRKHLCYAGFASQSVVTPQVRANFVEMPDAKRRQG